MRLAALEGESWSAGIAIGVALLRLSVTEEVGCAARGLLMLPIDWTDLVNFAWSDVLSIKPAMYRWLHLAQSVTFTPCSFFHCAIPEASYMT